ncbi:hypothetical protein F3B42_26180 [Bacteroides ovatus]|uniref:Uncharacterized protein n=1 Tax=Bacteroides ovatus TaxID=28116 RepID=A0A7J4XQA4_BACOV|nr:hypothetical protein F3B90_25890 [Bacteroides ovatus]KAA4633192.1 hypothetical protein F3B52_25895 [Bacteroides ovatus]KAA4667958.1 hypothetical protein F3B42_26180 [Bacteroides ovatus]KAA4676922.1 hypothetical protein F3B41_26275 [Bacteroides ovatus]NAA09872.1 hypothetical protein [Escherichia coli]
MKTKLKYPIFSFAPKGNMIYVFRKEELYTTTNTELLKKRKNYIVVDFEEYFLRAGLVMLVAMFLYHVVWRLIQKA